VVAEGLSSHLRDYLHVAFSCLLGFAGEFFWQVAEQNLEDVIEHRELAQQVAIFKQY
jgi:hypothetical protein